MSRILSGIQPSGSLHLGNYFGMMRPALELQEAGEAFIIIVNYHALTSVRDPDDLRRWTRELAVDFLAAGFDAERGALFLQTDVPEVTELTWILSTATPMGLLERCHAYKDKLARGLPPSAGLFVYPVLQAADILLYDSDVVPVGKDQKQHIEVARDIAVKMNETYGEIFKLPEPDIRDEVATVLGTDGQKMSKSYGNTIPLFGAEKAIRKRVMSVVTDSTPLEAPKDPAGSNVLALYRLVASPAEVRAMEQEFQAGGVGYGTFKQRLFEAIWEELRPMRDRRERLERDPAVVDEALRRGAERARGVASGVMDRVRRAVGLA